jgi:hypothetical protein
MIPGWLLRAADEFWGEAGPPLNYPRDLTLPALRAYILHRQIIPGLRLSAIEAWFAQRECRLQFDEPDRRLRGCLTAVGGTAIVFIDGADGPAEHRFTFAHEIAHLLLDYVLPRRRAIARIGPGIVDVLDGVRPPTAQERIDSALNDCPLGLHIALLDRRNPTAQLTQVESKADQLAWELLAPDEELDRRFGTVRISAAELTQHLIDGFGFPAPEAERYAARWLHVRQGPVPLIRLI